MSKTGNRGEQLALVMASFDGQAPGQGLAKHLKMTTSPFEFFRGSASLFYHDLNEKRLSLPLALTRIPLTMVVGDCHVSNFGFFSEEGSHGDHVIFAPNDFDDACVGYAGWDLLRYLTSLVLAVDHCQGIEQGRYADPECKIKAAVDDKPLEQALASFCQHYLATCESLLTQQQSYDSVLDHFDKQHILGKRYQKAVVRSAGGEAFAEKSSLAKAVDLTHAHTLRFRDRPGRFERLMPGDHHKIEYAFAPYVDDEIVDIVARLGAGTGSVNLERYYLLVGPAEWLDPHDWPLYHIVELKKQRLAAPLHYFADLSPVNRLNPAHLTAECQRRMQRAPDLVLDEVEWQDAHWLVRSRHHARVGIDPKHIAMGKKANKGGLVDYAASCGQALALAHGRADRRSQRFELALAEQLPEAIEPLIAAARDYAGQVKADWQWLCEQEG